MQNNIFRQKSIDKINSPESLNDYLKVTNPSVWIVLAGSLILIIGALVFCTIGKVGTNVVASVSSENGTVIAYIDEADISVISADMKVKIDGEEYSIKSVSKKPVKGSELDEYTLHKSNMETSQWLFPLTLDAKLKDGAYVGTITVEQVSPISYIFN